ncbi:MAG: citrate/2-methylcitrate synthase [Anaerolineae bacterium]
MKKPCIYCGTTDCPTLRNWPLSGPPSAARRRCPATLDLLQTAAAQQVPAIDALRMAAGTLSLAGPAAPEQQALTLVATFPTIMRPMGGCCRPGTPRPPARIWATPPIICLCSLVRPTPEHVRGLETYLNTVVDHGMNASTFTARVIISTQSDLISAVVGALGALKGPLHGGAPGPALDMVFDIGEADRAETYLRDKLARGERLMGFGHRIYKVRDPRAEVLAAAAARMFRGNGHQALYQLSRQVEQTAVALLAEYKPGRNLQTNVEFYTALLLHGLDLTADLFTPTFAIGRVAGWIAHCFEQQQLSRIIRPQSAYVGPKNRRWLPVEARSSRVNN